MASTSRHSPRRARKLKRRFSSASTGGTWANSFAPLSSASLARGRGHPPSLSPPASTTQLSFSHFRPNLTDGSEVDDDPFELESHSDREPTPGFHSFRGRTRNSLPKTYASLPPTPISPSPPSRPFTPTLPVSPISLEFDTSITTAPPFSLWDYLREELLATDFDSHQELKWDRVSNFLSMPLAIEKASFETSHLQYRL